MKVVTTKQMREMDRIAIQEYQIPSVVLMEHAAMAIKKHLDVRNDRQKEVLILCGPGNNGGDGFALARLLVQDGYEHVSIICNVRKEQQSKDEQVFARICEAYLISVYACATLEDIKGVLQNADVMVDALFGTGLSRDITGFYYDLITYVNTLDVDVISIDIASGIHGDTGKVMGCAIQAKKTISFECYKPGLVRYPGSQYCHEVCVESIAMPKDIVASATGIEVIDEQMLKERLPLRVAHSNKGSYGKALMIGGSMQMPGAITLAAKAALASGIGTLTLAIPEGIHSILANKLEECMLLPLPMKDGYVSIEATEVLAPRLSSYQLIVIGNGLGRTEGGKALVDLVLKSGVPCLLDGDALYLASNLPSLQTCTSPLIITPHIKEMSYLCKQEVSVIQQDPLAAIHQFQQEHPTACIVLKDEHTLLQEGESCYINLAGNHALAKGGSGDVLCGMIAGLYGQSKQSLSSAICAVYVHALAADQLIQRKSAYSILPTDVLEEIAELYQTYEGR